MARVHKKGYSQLVLLVAFDFFFLSNSTYNIHLISKGIHPKATPDEGKSLSTLILRPFVPFLIHAAAVISVQM